MPTRWTRRGFLGLTAGVTLAAACGTKPGTVADDGSVTVEHAFGETKIPAPPQRVVSAGLTDQDDLLALGVVPIAVTDWFGGQPFGVWPWAQPKLGAAQPFVLSLADGMQVNQIAALKPDLIVATNAGVDKDTYDRLSQIAPTVPQSGQEAFFEPWKDQAVTIGQAVFKADEIKANIQSIDDTFAALGKANPQFGGKKVLLLQGGFVDDAVHATLPGWRLDFLTQMGLVIADTVNNYDEGGQAVIPRDRMVSVLDAADVLIWCTESDEQQGALVADPTFQQLRATARQRNVFTGIELAGAIAFSSVLSYPVVADRLPPLLAKALA